MRFWAAFAFLPPEYLVPMARAAEATGFHGVALPDHLFLPKDLASPYPYSADGRPPWSTHDPWPDPWVSIGAMAAVTERLRFMTNVYVAPVRDVFTVAKAVATASALSGGRVAFGCAPGWMREEFDATGQDYRVRGRRLDEMIAALRVLWSEEWAEFHGRYVAFDPVALSLRPPDPIPIYVGGESPAALRRAASLADGWIGRGHPPDGVEPLVAALRSEREAAGRADEPFETILAVLARPEPGLVREMEDLGVTGMRAAPWRRLGRPAPPLEDCVASLERFAEWMR